MLGETMQSSDPSNRPARGGKRGGGRRNRPRRPRKPQDDTNGPPRANEQNVPKRSAVARTTSTTLAELTSVRFDSIPWLPPALGRALHDDFQYELMTSVQAKSIPVIKEGGDVVCKARTGTGKTLAFLIPSLVRTLDHPGTVLVLSPTRELATQIYDEAIVLSKYLGISCTVVFGGTNIKKDVSRLSRGAPNLLVATPGRLLDLLSNYGLDVKLREKGVSVLVFDEADQLLEMGFRPDILRILEKLPRDDRTQTLMYSATFPQQLKSLIHDVLGSATRYKFVDCIGEAESNTHDHVPQVACISGLNNQFAVLDHLIQDCIRKSSGPSKIIVFFVTARLTQLFAEVFNNTGYNVLEIHSRKSQTYRTKVSNQFRNAREGILFTSDVSARGMDYPDVTAVVQVGVPTDRAQYIHRLGRTARIGREGMGVLLLADFGEKFFLKEIEDQQLSFVEPPPPRALDAMVSRFTSAAKALDGKTVGAAYQSFLGFYKGLLKKLKLRPEQLVALTNEWILEGVGATQVPALRAQTVGKMGLKGTPGLVIERSRR